MLKLFYWWDYLELWSLTPLSTIFQLYRGGHFIGGRNWIIFFSCWWDYLLKSVDICFVPLTNSISGVMLASSVVDHGFEPWSSQTKNYEISICCFYAKHAALRRKSKDWLARNNDNVSECGDMSIRWLVSVS